MYKVLIEQPAKLEMARKARDAFRFGAENEDAICMYELAELYQSGSLGNERNSVDAPLVL